MPLVIPPIVLAMAAVALLGGAALRSARYFSKRPRKKDPGLNRHEAYIINSIAETISNTGDLDSMLYFVLKETFSFEFLDIERGGAIFFMDDGTPDAPAVRASINFGRPGYAAVPEAGFCGVDASGRLVVPIRGRGGLTGALCYNLPKGLVPGRPDMDAIRSVAGLLAGAVENIGLARTARTAAEDLRDKGRELTKKVTVLNSLVEVDRIILSTLDRDEMLYRVSVQIRQLLPADIGGVALCDQETNDYRYVGGWGMEIKNRDIIQTSEWLANPMLNYGRPVMRGSLDREVILSPFDKLLRDTGVHSDLYAPIMRKGKTVGIFFLGCFREGAFTGEDVDVAVAFASRMGIALEHARLIYDLDGMSVNIIHALASAIDAKSSWTKGHSERVSEYAIAIAEKMGVGRHEVERLRLAGLLHDVGKIGTYDILLDKTTKLTAEEWELIKLHPNRGCEILEPITEFRDILPAVRHHHERWDGAGYPAGLKGDDIPMMARILTLADSFDTMTADRPYRPAIGLQNAMNEIRHCSGKQFAPDVSEVFLKMLSERGMDIVGMGSLNTHPAIWGTS